MLNLLLLSAAFAQSPEDAWRTVRTPHYRLHYTEDSEVWALYTAERLESIRGRVSEEVGYDPSTIVDIVVLDPFAQPNGFALPFLNNPRMAVFLTAPDPTSGIGHYRTWTEDLVTHEDAHLVHLMRPSRNSALRAVGNAFGFGPLILGTPAWVIEGYATVVEGRLTGLGRPYSSYRSTFIRSLAANGQMTRYDDLDLPDRWAAGAYRYLVGSAFLEWLVARSESETPLQDLWARMSAVEIRTFEEAFSGVFGDEPAPLYNRFVAEMTFEAQLIERARPSIAGTRWQNLEWTTAAPDVSPNGEQLALILRPKSGPSSLVVYQTGDDAEAQEKWEKDNLPDLEVDPEDVAPMRPDVYPREPAHQKTMGGRAPQNLRWIDDARLLFTDAMVGAGGDLRPELFIWTIDGGVTRLTDDRVSDADPHDDFAVGVRNEHGRSQLVRVDLGDGRVRSLTEPSEPWRVHSTPRVSPDGERLAWLLNQGAGWQIATAPLGEDGLGASSMVALPPHTEVLSLAFHPDGDALIASLGRGGFTELYQIPLGADGELTQLTRTTGGAVYPAPTPDGSGVFFLSPDVKGYDLHRQDLTEPLPDGPDDATLRESLALETPVVQPTPLPPVEALETRTVEPGRYSHRSSTQLLTGAQSNAQQYNIELGLAAGDVVGRVEALAFVSLGDETEIGPDEEGFGFRGLRGSFTWRRLPVRLRVEGAQRSLIDVDTQTFIAADLNRLVRWRDGGFYGHVGGWADVGASGESAGDLMLSAAHRLWGGPLYLGLAGDARGQVAGSGDVFGRGTGQLSVGGEAIALRGEAELGVAAGDGVFSFGGQQDPLYPEIVPTRFIWAPEFAVGSMTGQRLTRFRGDIGAPGAATIYYERTEMDGVFERIGLDVGTRIEPQPLIGMPGARLELGVACIIETAELGPITQPCRDLSNWAAWISLRYQPGEEFLIP
ncbi:MAG: hypothetical protein AAFV53_41330 [Myxococcota bacterium]